MPKCNGLHLGADLRNPPRHLVCWGFGVFFVFFNVAFDFKRSTSKVLLLIFWDAHLYTVGYVSVNFRSALAYVHVISHTLGQEWTPGERHLVVS